LAVVVFAAKLGHGGVVAGGLLEVGGEIVELGVNNVHLSL
jgi:hypothetical protein